MPPLFNKATASMLAKAALNQQGGKSSPLPGGEDKGLSEAAAKMKRMMKGVFGDSLPSSLPSWEDLGSIPAQDVLQIIKEKIIKESENSEQSSLSAFEKATACIDVPAGKDDGVSQLQEARWYQLPFSPPEKWSSQAPVARENIVAMRYLKHLGLDSKFPINALKKMHHRTKRLKLVEFLATNTNVEDSEPVLKRQRTGEVGYPNAVGIVASWNFQDAQRPWEVLEAMAGANAVQQILFPTDHSYNVINLTLIKFQMFYDPDISKKTQMKIINMFINDMLQKNATRASNRLTCEDIDTAEKAAFNALRANNRPPVPPPMRDLMAAGAVQGGQIPHRPPGAGDTLSPQRGRGRGRGSDQMQRAGKPNQAPGDHGSSRQSGIQTCPKFNQGTICPRSTDQSAKSCLTKAGITLYHLCSKCGAPDHGLATHK